MPRIVLAEDHQIVRQGLVSLLESVPDCTVVGQAGSGLEAVRLVQEHSPDLLIVDLTLPELHGLEVVRQVQHQTGGTTQAIVLSMHSTESFVIDALRYGASAYVLKGGSLDDLLVAIEHVQRGERYLSPALEMDLESLLLRIRNRQPSDSYEQLTTREREILQLVAEGCTSAEIATRLFISPRTADTHRKNVMNKLGLRNIPELVRYAVDRGLLGSQPPPS